MYAVVKEVYGVWYLEDSGLTYAEAQECAANTGDGLGNIQIVTVEKAEEMIGQPVG